MAETLETIKELNEEENLEETPKIIANPLLDTVMELSKDLKNVDTTMVDSAITKIWLRKGLSLAEKEKHVVLQCRQKEYAHYEWSLLAGRLQIKFHRKNIPKTFSESTKSMKEILHPWYYNFVMENASWLDEMVDESKDMTFDIFAADTLISSYLARIVIDGNTWVCETPQFMYMRVAVFLWFEFSGCSSSSSSGVSSSATPTTPTITKKGKKSSILKGEGRNEYIKATYTDLSNGAYSHASPTLFNSGMLKHQLASCFTATIGDSIKNLTKSWHDIAYISKDSGGLGLDFSALRHSEISRNGQTNGVIPWIRIAERVLITVNQCFGPSTTVYTANRGPVKISKVVPGDEVIRSDGKTSIVAEQIRYAWPDETSKLYNVSVSTYAEDIVVTGKHPIYCLQFPAEVQNVEDVMTAVYGGSVVPAYVPVESFTTSTYVGTPTPVYEKDISHFTVEDCRFYGILLGRTFTHTNRGLYNLKPSKGMIDLCLDLVECASDIGFVESYLDSHGIEYVAIKRSGTNVCRYVFDSYSRGFKFTKKMFLKHADIHRFHPAFLHLPLTKVSAIYQGYLSGSDVSRIYIPNTLYDSIRYLQIRLGITPFRSFGEGFGDSSDGEDGGVTIGQKETHLESFFLNGMIWSRVSALSPVQSSPQSSPAKSSNDVPEYVVDLEMEPVKGETEEEYANYLTSLGIAHNGGRRKGSGTGFLCDWHLDIEDFISLKNPENPEDLRALGMTFSVNIHDLFMERCEKDEDWTLFCPNKTNGLVYKYGTEFETSYLELEQKARDGKIPASKVVKARKLFEKMMLSSLRTANPFVLFIDAGNRKSNQQNLGTTRLSNLCMEILLFSGPKDIGSCNLAAVNLSRCLKLVPVDNLEHTGGVKLSFDYEELERLTRALTRNINQVIDRNFYHKHVPQIEYTNMRNRPEGIGYMGLADVVAKLDLTWDCDEVRKLNIMISETMYYAAVSESCLLAQRYGAYETFKGSPTSEGLLQFDLWKREAVNRKLSAVPITEENVGNITRAFSSQVEFESFSGEASSDGYFGDEAYTDTYMRYGTERYDWGKVRKDVVTHGLRNSLLIALMPTATSAHILGTNESFEPYTQHIFTRTILAGQYVVTNKHLVDDLQELGLWNTAVARNIWENEGSVQNIPEFFYLTPAAVERLRYLKKKYLTVYELPQQLLHNLCIDRATYVCQTQSFNCWMKDATVSKLISFFHHGWKHGLKTGIYYLRQPAKKNPLNHALKNIRVVNNRDLVKEEYVCTSCSV